MAAIFLFVPLAAGTRLGPYQIAAPLGAGGMGEVYRARDTRLQREVAIKVLPAAMAHSRLALQRLEQEARAVAALNHPNLLSVYDVGETPEGLPFLVSELLEGESLRQRLRAGALGAQRAVEYAVQIAQGLAAAHDKGIIHRDLKPENIFITQDGRVKILDFGLAKLTAAASSEEATVLQAPATAPGVVLGTVGYMAPEQVRGQAADARSDIFGLGAVLYEMLSGRRPFRGDSAVEVMSAILREDPEPLSPGTAASTGSGARQELSPALDRIVRHCLEKQPRQRFQSADDVAFNLAGLSQPGSTAALAALAAPRRRWTVPILSAALVLVAGAAVWFGSQAGATGGPPALIRATYRSGAIASARFLPGGNNIVLSAAWGSAGGASLFTGPAPTPALALAAPHALNAPGIVAAVSPAGAVAVLAGDPQASDPSLLSVIPATGGAPRPLYRAIFGAAWPPHGLDLAISRNVRGFGDETTLEYPPGHVLYRASGYFTNLRFSPDGKTIAFLDHPEPGDTGGSVAVVDLQGHERLLTPEFAEMTGLAWRPDGKEIWFSGSPKSDNDSLFAVTLSGRVRRVWQATSDLKLDDIAADGRVLVIASQVQRAARVRTPDNASGEALSAGELTAKLILSRDGRLLATGAYDAPQYSTYLRTLGSSAEAVRLGDGMPDDISADGKWVLSTLPDPWSSLELLPTGPGQPRLLVPAGKLMFVAGDARFLPGTGSVLAVAAIPGRQMLTYLIQPDGTFKGVTPSAVMGEAPLPNGKSTVAWSMIDGSTRIYPFAGGAALPVQGLKAGDTVVGFGAGGNQLFVSQSAGTSAQIFALNPQTGARRLVATVHSQDSAGFQGFTGFSLSSDARVVAYGYTTKLSTLYLVTGLR